MDHSANNCPTRSANEAGYRLLFEANPAPMWVHDLSTLQFLAVNQAAIEHYGYSRDEFLAMTIKDIRPAEDVPALVQQISKIRKGVRKSGIWRHRKRDGSLIRVQITSQPIVFSGRQANLVLATDITERTGAEDALRKSEARFRRLAESNMVGITIGNEAGDIVYANDAYLGVVGYTRDDLQAGRVRWDLLTPPDQWDVIDVIQKQMAATGVVEPLETVHIHKDGHRVPLLIGLAKLEEEEHHAICFVLDLTARKKAEEALRIEANQLQTISEAMATYLASGDWRRSSSTILRGALRQTGSEYGFVGALAEDRILRIFAHEGIAWHLTENREFYEKAMRTYKEVGYLEFTNFNNLFGRVITSGKSVVSNDPATDPRSGGLPPGHPPLRQFLGVPILLANKVLGMIGVANRRGGYTMEEQSRLEVLAQTAAVLFDSYGQREQEVALQGQLRQAHKMEAVGRLAGGVAHDFNNLLTVIGGYSDLILDRLSSDHPLCSQISEIKKASDRAAGLTRQLLAFGRQQKLQPQILDLNSVLSGTAKMLQRLIGEDIELKTHLAGDLGPVKADPIQIEQVIMNLAVNARDAMLGGGKLTIETSNVEVDDDFARAHTPIVPGSYTLVAVSDTGVGMDVETQKHIFEPFFTTKEQGKGTGLGLATVYGIVKQSGGFVWVKSSPGKGTTFKIYLPRVEATAQPAQPQQVRERAVEGSETLLLVEDETAVRQLAATILREHGYKVLESSNLNDAIRTGETYTERIDLLITDVVMPGMKGQDVAKHLAFFRPEMKVLYMSGYTNNRLQDPQLIGGNGNFIQKPFAPYDLARKVRELLDSE